MRHLLTLLAAAAALPAQSFSSLNCVATAVPALVRLEGLTERLGDIVLSCAGTPNGPVRADIRVISFSGNITNKRHPDTNSIDAVLTVDTGSGPVSTGATPLLYSANQFDFAGIQFTLGPSGLATLRISNVRITPPSSPGQSVQLSFATNGPSAIRVDNSPLTVATTTRGLLASYSSTFVCALSPLPAEINFPNLLASGIRFASMRFTEGFAESFTKRQPLSDHGSRILLQFSGFPPGARLFTPTVIAGSSATIPTSAGDLGLPANGGRYTPSPAGHLLLTRVANPSPSGAGGSLAYSPLPGVSDFSDISEVPLSSGAGVAVFEVLDSDLSARESFQVPIFLGLDQRPPGGSVSASVTASLGPISSDATPSPNPVPRFLLSTPPPDCQALGDCNSGIFPRLSVDSEPLLFNPVIGQFPQTHYIRLRNDGGGLLNWSARIQYTSGSGWLSLDPPAGLGNATIRLDASSTALAPGVYDANLIIDAGPLAGSATLPVRMEARQFGPNPLLPPEISAITHAATFERVPLAPGTLATAFGLRLAGDDVQLNINGIPARIFFSNATQINFEVPPSLPTSGAVNAFVTVDTRNSPARALSLAPASPGIFPNAVLNQDFSVNTASNPALSGSVLQLFLTGLPVAPDPVTVRLHDYTVAPLFAGPAPGFIGLQQVNVQVPPDLQSLTSEISVCAGAVCSPARPVTVRRP
jgi:uncharacterized protein (TIGR03437 family)